MRNVDEYDGNVDECDGNVDECDGNVNEYDGNVDEYDVTWSSYYDHERNAFVVKKNHPFRFDNLENIKKDNSKW